MVIISEQESSAKRWIKWRSIYIGCYTVTGKWSLIMRCLFIPDLFCYVMCQSCRSIFIGCYTVTGKCSLIMRCLFILDLCKVPVMPFLTELSLHRPLHHWMWDLSYVRDFYCSTAVFMWSPEIEEKVILWMLSYNHLWDFLQWVSRFRAVTAPTCRTQIGNTSSTRYPKHKKNLSSNSLPGMMKVSCAVNLADSLCRRHTAGMPRRFTGWNRGVTTSGWLLSLNVVYLNDTILVLEIEYLRTKN